MTNRTGTTTTMIKTIVPTPMYMVCSAFLEVVFSAICDSSLGAFTGLDEVPKPEQSQYYGSELRRGAKRQTATLAPEQLSSFVEDADRCDVDELDLGEVDDDISDGPFDNRGHRVHQQLRSRCLYIAMEGENHRLYSWAAPLGIACALRATSDAH